MRRLILAAAIAAASASFALAPAFADDTDTTPPASVGSSPDSAGVDDLGIDISGVTLTPAGVHGFISQLAPATRHAVEDACSTDMRYPQGVGEATLAFCADAHKA